MSWQLLLVLLSLRLHLFGTRLLRLCVPCHHGRHCRGSRLPGLCACELRLLLLLWLCCSRRSAWLCIVYFLNNNGESQLHVTACFVPSVHEGLLDIMPTFADSAAKQSFFNVRARSEAGSAPTLLGFVVEKLQDCGCSGEAFSGEIQHGLGAHSKLRNCELPLTNHSLQSCACDQRWRSLSLFVSHTSTADVALTGP